MNHSKPVLLLVGLAALALLAVALILQHGMGMQPCPLCVLQRYAFAAVALVCLLSLLLPALAARIGTGLAMLATLAGAGVAGHHVWLLAQPAASCGIDPLETPLNELFSARLLPFLFRADGLCTTEYAPILGLSIPQWALLWFILFFLALAWSAFFKRARR